MKENTIFFQCLWLFACMTSLPLQAAQWHFEPTVNLRSGYNNNITLTTNQDKPSSTQMTFIPKATFSRNTETTSLSGTLSSTIRRYLEESRLNDDNMKVNIDTLKRFPNLTYRAGLSLNKDTTLDTELEETGVIFGRTNRTRRTFNPSITWQYNQRTNINFSYNLNDTAYDENTQGYVNSLSHLARFSLSRSLNERSSASLTATQALTDSENDVLSRYTNLQASYQYNLSRTLSTSLSAGIRKTTTKFSRIFFLANGVIPFSQIVKVSDYGSVFSIATTKGAPRGNHTLSLNRDINNSVSGRLIEITRLKLGNTYSLSNRFSTSLDLSYYQSESTNDPDTINNISREYYTINPSISWKLSKLWLISSNYRFKKQKNTTSGGSNAIQNSIYINLTYRWPRIVISH